MEFPAKPANPNGPNSKGQPVFAITKIFARFDLVRHVIACHHLEPIRLSENVRSKNRHIEKTKRPHVINVVGPRLDATRQESGDRNEAD
jgi:hypothetical protein